MTGAEHMPVRLIVEFEGRPLMSQVLTGGAVIHCDHGDARPAAPGDSISWTDVPGLVIRYEAVQ